MNFLFKHHSGLVPVLLVVMLACVNAPSPPKPETIQIEGATYCADPRPELCTRDHRPVCGQHRDGSERIYGNACTACSDLAVTHHFLGVCESFSR